MKLLAWDTSSKVGSIVALEWDPEKSANWSDVKLIAELTLNVDATHSERLLWGIHQVLESARWRLDEIGAFGVGQGPGSFTGLRIGMTTARTLAHSLEKPLIGVSSLAALARPVALFLEEGFPKQKIWVVATTDACKGELFALWGEANQVRQCVIAHSEISKSLSRSLWSKEVEEQVLSPEALCKKLKENLKDSDSPTRWIAVGEGRHRYLENWQVLPGKNEILEKGLFPDHVQGRYLGWLVWEAYQAGARTGGLEVYPQYLRSSDAEIQLKAGMLKSKRSQTRGGG